VSANQLWRYGKSRMYRSAAYQAWLKTCDGEILAQIGALGRRTTITGAYALDVYLDIAMWKRADLDNCLKALGDVLQRNAIVTNDKNCFRLNVLWSEVENSNPQHPLCLCDVREMQESCEITAQTA